MMAGNPNWWSMNGMHPQLSSHLLYGAAAASSNSPNPSPSPPPHLLHQPNQDFPVRSWSQMLMGGIGGGEEEEEEESNNNMFQQQKKVEKYWEQHEQDLNPSSSPFSRIPAAAAAHHQFQTTWPRQHHHPPPPVSSPASSITTFNFSSSSKTQDHSSECNSTRTGGVSKKARVQHSSAQPALKVRKEKLGERITSLHQIVSPFGKTDTASVLSEAIGYIRFLQSQIEALSSPYMRNAAAAAAHHQHSVQERNCLFPEEPSQFLNDISMEGRGVCKQVTQGRSGMKDLRSRGLCLVPISCTQHVGSDTGADYWAPAAFGGSF